MSGYTRHIGMGGHINVTTPRPLHLITISKQTSPFEERVTRNGIQRDIHVVIKNSPFHIVIDTVKNADVNLNHVAFDCTLLYDTEGEKGVDFVKVKPVEFKSVPNETGDQVTMELRIKVLTSQHEDMFFKVMIQGLDPLTKQEITNMKVVTAPIKVISKPEQLKKKQVAPPSKKRTVNDMVVEAVTRIEKHQSEQSDMLERIIEHLSTSKSQQQSPVTTTTSTPWDLPPIVRIPSKDTEPGEFEMAFAQLLRSFASIDPNHRAEKVRRIIRGYSVNETECLSELVDLLMTEGLGIEIGRETRPCNEKSCACPNKHDLEKIDNIFFSSMVPPYANCNVGGMHPGEDHYPDFLSPPNPNNPDFLM